MPAFKKLKKLRSALGLKPSALPESKDLAEGSLKHAEIEKAVKDLVGEAPGIFDLLNNNKHKLDNLKKALNRAEKVLANNPEALAELENLKNNLLPIDHEFAAKVKKGFKENDPVKLAQSLNNNTNLPEFLQELLDKNNGDLAKALDEAERLVFDDPEAL